MEAKPPSKKGSKANWLNKKFYEKEIKLLQEELVKLQYWVIENGYKLILTFDGRDAAGKGGIIKRIIEPLNPRGVRLVALPAPNDRERTQWYFQRYVSHFPAAGEIVIFDRSWYNRGGVERVMDFCTDEEYWEFLRSVPYFERMLHRAGVHLIKYWISVSREEQEKRFQSRASDPMRQWKLSPMDLTARKLWNEYSKAKDLMMEHTDTPEGPWHQIEGDDKRKARLNGIRHLLDQIPYTEIPANPISLEKLDMTQQLERPPRDSHEVVKDYYKEAISFKDSK